VAAAGTEARLNLIVGVGAVFGRPNPRVAVTADVTMPPTQIHYDLIDGRSLHSAAHVARLAPSLGVELRF
jgi:phosphoglucomutase